MHACDEANSLLFQQMDTAIDNALGELHVRDAVHEQPADPIGAFVDRYAVADFVELRGGGQSGRTGSHDGHFLAGAFAGWMGLNPTFGKAPVNNRVFDVLDGDWG